MRTLALGLEYAAEHTAKMLSRGCVQVRFLRAEVAMGPVV
jgi:hypothetical protein